jgi:hypothetical protein
MKKFNAILLATALGATSPGLCADDFEAYLIVAISPQSSEWKATGDDPTGIGAFGVKRLNWIANDGKDRILLFIDPENKSSPAESLASDVHAGGKNCKAFTNKTEFGTESGPFLGWASECTLKNGSVMTLKHFAYVKGLVGYKVSRIWRERPSNESLAEWSKTIASVVTHINESK